MGAFLTRFYCKMLFWALFGTENRDLIVLPAHKFTGRLYKCVIIHHRNLFIYGFHSFGSIYEQLLQQNGIVGPFWTPKLGFRVLPAHKFDIIS